jgi:uncharacterized OsmC-like protein
MEVRIRHGSATQSEAFARFHRVVCDHPFDDGGGDNGMTAPELMLSALGCCAMDCAVAYLRARKLAAENVGIRISATEGGDPRRLVEIGIEVDAPGLGAKAREGLLKAIETCMLQQTLAVPPKLNVAMAAMVTETPRARMPANLVF